MTTWIFKQTELAVWTVGFYEPDGTFAGESAYGSPEEAAAQVHWLNGGCWTAEQEGSRAAATDTLDAVLDPVHDMDQCSGCDAVYEWDNTRSYCPYHQGLMSGYDRAMGEIAEAAGAFQLDPELADLVVDRAEQMRVREYELAQQTAANKPQPEPEGLTEHERELLETPIGAQHADERRDVQQRHGGFDR